MKIQVKELKSILNKVKNFSEVNKKNSTFNNDILKDTIYFDDYIQSANEYKSIRMKNNTNIIGSFSIKELKEVIKSNDINSIIDLNSYNTNQTTYYVIKKLHDDKFVNDLQSITINKKTLNEKLKIINKPIVLLKFKDMNNDNFEIAINNVYLNQVLTVLKVKLIFII